jgi:aconitate hydratase
MPETLTHKILASDLSPAERAVLTAGGLLAQVRTGGRSLLATDAVVQDDVAGASQSRSAR